MRRRARCLVLLLPLLGARGVRPDVEEVGPEGEYVRTHRDAEEIVLPPNDAFRGGPYVGACEQLTDALNREEACTVDEFSSQAWITAVELDCQLQKAQNVLELVTKKFQQAAVSHKEAKSRITKRRTSQMTLRSQSGGKQDGADLGEVPRFSSLRKCPRHCARCIGHLHYTTPDGRQLLVLPQPGSTGSSYGYPGSEIKVLRSIKEITLNDRDAINKGLWYATVLGASENYTETERLYFSAGVQKRLRYRGNDPAILMELATPLGRGDASSMCLGGPNRNMIDPGNFHEFFEGTRKFRPVDERHARPYWKTGGREEFMAVASKVTLDAHHLPMGTLTLDVDMAALSEKFLNNLQITPSVYTVIVDTRGRIIAISPRGRSLIFGENVTEDDIHKKGNLTRCHHGMTEEELADCTWDPLQAISILFATDTDQYSGANFGEVISSMFDRSGGRSANCSKNMLEADVAFPKARGSEDEFHLVSFCAFTSVPEWGLIIGTKYRDINEAAAMSLDKNRQELSRSAPSDEELEELKDEHFQVNLKNRGRVPLPWLVDDQRADFVTVEPQNGQLKPGDSILLNFTVRTAMPDFGTYAAHVRIRGDAEEPRGACFRHTATLLVKMRIERSRTALQRFMKRFGKWVLFSLVVLIIAITVKLAASYVTRWFKNEAQQAKIVDEALSSVRSLAHPMVLMTAISFKKLGRLVSHEEAQSLHEVTWLYSVQEVEAFCAEKRIVFVSHQWTAFESPDPSNIQYNAMVMSIETLLAKEGWDESDLYVWVDYTSIPQRHRGTQQLAINSLTVYASKVAAFVVVAPPVQHKDLSDMCNKETYQRRAWCRAEQLSHLLAAGTKNMYLAESGVLTPLTSIEGWLEQSMYVFQGDLTCCRRQHKDMKMCDKQFLVTPMLGLWAQLCQRCEDPSYQDPQLKEIHDKIGSKLQEIFPPTFVFEKPSGSKETRSLFGTLLQRLPDVFEDDRK